MKKSILQFSVIAAIAASMTLTTSCSSDENVAEAYVPEPVQFSVGLGDLSVSRASSRTQASDTEVPAIGTNFTIDNKWQQHDKLAIYTHDADGKWYLKQYDVNESSTSANQANAITANGVADASKDFYWGSTTEVKVFEVYSIGTSGGFTNTPAANRIDDATNKSNKGLQIFYDSSNLFDVPSDQTTSNKEFLYNYGAMKYATTGSNTKALNLRHQLTRIDVVIITPKSKSDTENDKEVYIGNHANTEKATKGIYLKGYFDKPAGLTAWFEDSAWPTSENLDGLSTGGGSYTSLTWYPVGDRDFITPRVISKETQISGGTHDGKYTTKYSAVVIPQNFENYSLFDIVYDGARYVYTGVAADDLSTAAGKHYTYQVVVGPTGLVVTASISDWTEAAGYTSASPKDATAVLQ